MRKWPNLLLSGASLLLSGGQRLVKYLNLAPQLNLRGSIFGPYDNTFPSTNPYITSTLIHHILFS